MLRYTFAVITAFSIYALNVYNAAHTYIGFGVTK